MSSFRCGRFLVFIVLLFSSMFFVPLVSGGSPAREVYILSQPVARGTLPSLSLPVINQQLSLLHKRAWGISWTGFNNTLPKPVNVCAKGSVTVYQGDAFVEKVENEAFTGFERYRIRFDASSGQAVLAGNLIPGCGDVPDSAVHLKTENTLADSRLTVHSAGLSGGVILLFELLSNKQADSGYPISAGQFQGISLTKTDFPFNGFSPDDDKDRKHWFSMPHQSSLGIQIYPFYNSKEVVGYSVIVTEPDGSEVTVSISDADIKWLMANYHSHDDEFSESLRGYISSILILRTAGRTYYKFPVMTFLRNIYRASELSAFNQLIDELSFEVVLSDEKHLFSKKSGNKLNGKRHGGGETTSQKNNKAVSNRKSISRGKKVEQSGRRKTQRYKKEKDNSGDEPPNNSGVQKKQQLPGGRESLKRKNENTEGGDVKRIKAENADGISGESSQGDTELQSLNRYVYDELLDNQSTPFRFVFWHYCFGGPQKFEGLLVDDMNKTISEHVPTLGLEWEEFLNVSMPDNYFSYWVWELLCLITSAASEISKKNPDDVNKYTFGEILRRYDPVLEAFAFITLKYVFSNSDVHEDGGKTQSDTDLLEMWLDYTLLENGIHPNWRQWLMWKDRYAGVYEFDKEKLEEFIRVKCKSSWDTELDEIEESWSDIAKKNKINSNKIRKENYDEKFVKSYSVWRLIYTTYQLSGWQEADSPVNRISFMDDPVLYKVIRELLFVIFKQEESNGLLTKRDMRVAEALIDFSTIIDDCQYNWWKFFTEQTADQNSVAIFQSIQ